VKGPSVMDWPFLLIQIIPNFMNGKLEHEIFSKLDDNKLLNTALKHTGISKRTVNALFKCNIKTVYDLLNYLPDDDMTFVPGIGKKSIEEISKFLDSKGINWLKYSHYWLSC
jgi:DNA-directed RNA polymerase alpha subunit